MYRPDPGASGRIADGFLVHDRPIRQPLDDSVLRVADGKPLMLRRARGYVPRPVALDADTPPILAAGGHLKNTVAYADGGRAILSQHLGDLDTAESLDRHRATAERLPRLFGRPPRSVACDLHPDYAATRWTESTGLPLRRVPHHLAHALACMAEHSLKPPLLAVTWDGLGLGEDGTLWGGEFLRIAPDGHRRIASLLPLRLPGANARSGPAAVGLSVLYALHGEETPDYLPATLKSRFEPADLSVIAAAADRHAIPGVAAGRLFDAAASLLGLCRDISFEGQAAMALEAAAERGGEGDGTIYPMPLIDGEPKRLDWRPLFRALSDGHAAGVPATVLAFRFHASLAAAVAAIAATESIPTVVLAGGCFQNRLLLELCTTTAQCRLTVYWPEQVPQRRRLGAGPDRRRDIFRGVSHMCLAVPGQILSIEQADDPLLRSGRVDFGGVVKVVNLAYVPEAEIGDYVIVHAGFAISRLDEAEAQAVLKEIAALEDVSHEIS